MAYRREITTPLTLPMGYGTPFYWQLVRVAQWTIHSYVNLKTETGWGNSYMTLDVNRMHYYRLLQASQNNTMKKNCSHRCKCNYKYNDHYCTATATIFSFPLTSFLFLCCWRLDHIRKRERMEINGNYRHDALAVVQPPVSKCWSQDSLAYQFINFNDFCLPELYFYTHFLKTLSYIVYIAYRVNYARLYKLMTVSGHWVSKWFSILKIEFLVVNKYVFNPQMLYIVHGDWNEISLYKS